METYIQNVNLSQFELDWTRDHISVWPPCWHFFEDLDYFPGEAFWRLSEYDYPKVLRTYHVFSELFLRDSNISEPCRRPPRTIILTRRQQIYRNLRKGNKCLSNVLSLILYMTRKISAILRVFNTYHFSHNWEKNNSVCDTTFFYYLIYLWRALYWTS